METKKLNKEQSKSKSIKKEKVTTKKTKYKLLC